jgi:PKD repeat protein
MPYKNYFGQLHSHTAENSDGAGTLAEAYAYARDASKLDFFAVTDHSNSFDNKPSTDKAGTYNLGDYNKDNVKWVNGQQAASNARRGNFISVYAYEMTWSGGPGHINTFATDGFVSRNNAELNTKANDAGLKAYYQLLKDTPNSISQFNHPGETFGNFSDFSYLDPTIDARISLVEVGNGEGAVGSGAYFPSYEEYTKALDKGWHLAPTNNQDNHKKLWGNSNTARTVIYTNDLSVNGLYDALRDMRVYATEDNNLDIVYTLNGEMLGSIIQEVPGQAAFNISVADSDSTDKIQSISIISNGGEDIYTQTYSSQNATLEKTINSPAAGYYYIKVVEEDGQIAVTAPIWLGSAPRIGIDSVGYDTMMPVTNEPMTFTTKLFNNESEAAAVKSISYKIKDGSTIGIYDINENIASSGMYTHTQSYTFTQPGIFTVTITAVLSQNGQDEAYTKDIEVNVRDSEKLVYVGIDASHDNEYVAGNYKASMGNFAKLASKFNVRAIELKTSEELISAMQNPKYKMMVFTVPSRRNGTAGRIPFKSYSQNEIDAAAAFAKSGRTVIITGWGDFYENYDNLKKDANFTADQHMAAQQNKLLAAIGANLRITDDEAKDNSLNGGQAQRLYLTDHNNYVDPFTQGIVDGQVYSQYGGSTIFAVDSKGNPLNKLPSFIKPTISGHATTFSSDDDKDANAAPPKYNDKVLLMAHETLTHQDGTKSTVIAAGGAFMSNFEIQVEIENAGTLPYSNYNILQNLIVSIANISTIADVRNMTNGTDVVIEGIATTDVYNGSDNNKGFFDCIYVQDQTGGINLFPVSSGVEAGQRIRVTGRVSEYQGEKQIQNAKFTVIDSNKNLVVPKSVTPQQAMSAANTGSLVTFRGNVTEIIKDNDGVVGQLMVSGARVYINGYVTKNISLADIKVGDTVQVTGIASIGENLSSDTDFLPRIRIRDRGEIVVNTTPVLNAGDDAAIDEGSLFSRTGSFTDSDTDTWSATVNYGDGADQTLALNADKTFALSHTYADNGTYQVTVTVDDGKGGIATDIITVTVNNAAPSVGAISGYIAPIQKGRLANFSARFTDLGTADTHTARWDWGDGSSTIGNVTQGAGFGLVADSHTYTKVGIYNVTLTVTDDDGSLDISTCEYDVVVYDPSAGFVTGSGWIDSPAGAYKANPQLKGKATFSFDSKYQKGTNIPTGNTQFQFKAGNISFNSTSFEWLVIAENTAQYEGSGTINGMEGYKFMLTAIDGGRRDMFRIKILNESTGEVIYDNIGGDDTNNNLTVIGGGSIDIHAK